MRALYHGAASMSIEPHPHSKASQPHLVPLVQTNGPIRRKRKTGLPV
jgi:hypothetical protein